MELPPRFSRERGISLGMVTPELGPEGGVGRSERSHHLGMSERSLLFLARFNHN